MTYLATRRSATLLLLLGLLAAPAAEAGQNDWPAFRGPAARGHVAAPATPTTWNLATGENVLWKITIPGLGHSSPVVWGERVFITTAVASEKEAELKVGLYGDVAPAQDDGVQSWRTYCLDKRTGKILWQRTAHEGTPRQRRHTKSSHANPTPATDGDRVVVFFGSEGLFTYDMDGNLLWQKDFGVLQSSYYMMPPAQWGFASSPILHQGKVIVQCDILKGSFLAAFDAKDGRELWRTMRDEFPTWSTPTVVESTGRTQIVVNGYKHLGGYDFETGAELWRMTTPGGDIPVPTPVAAHDLVFLTSAHGAKSPVLAIRTGARGDISLSGEATSNEHVAWSIERGGAYMQTPVVVGDELYVCRDNGVLTCYDARTGTQHYQERLAGGGGFTASSVGAGDKVYFSSEEGEIHVVKTGPKFEKLAVNAMGETVMATPAISDGVIFFRTRHHVVAIGERPVPAPEKPAP